MKLYTIGFTGKSDERFFQLLETAKPKSLVDIRLNNTSQLAGFSKFDDLAFFLRRILNLPYRQARARTNPTHTGQVPEGKTGLGRLREELHPPDGETRHTGHARAVRDGRCVSPLQ
jgi:hypothetical protein